MVRVKYRLVRPAAPTTAQVVADPDQALVVAHRAGPLLVLGGPGTGKTTTLVESVAARVGEGTPADRVLVLTFGRRMAAALRTRVESRTGAAGGAISPPAVRTFHAFAFGLLRQAAAQRGQPAPRLLTGPEQDLVIRELLDGDRSGWPAGLSAALGTRAFAQQLRDLMLRTAERGLDAAGLAKYGAALGREDWVAAANFLRRYHQVLALRDLSGRAGEAYDTAELIRAATSLLDADPGLLATVRAGLSTVYVDEYADTDPAQRDLLARIAGGGAHLVAFADPDSSTYAFRGADPGGVTAFPERFRRIDGQPAPVLTLRRSHRVGAGPAAS
ncbi:MAG: UvrD-helicase domain-containing protein, partial [Micromonosporaceae bacterium]|nr:UvrD-helicase domain-containing protein [Micromonosporaceae bacterium]